MVLRVLLIATGMLCIFTLVGLVEIVESFFKEQGMALKVVVTAAFSILYLTLVVIDIVNSAVLL